jgi:chemotaxis protein CheD
MSDLSFAFEGVNASGSPASSATKRASAYIHAGQFFVGGTPTSVTTIVGSCVAVCLFDEALQIGGLNHYLLAEAPPQNSQVGRFGDSATVELITQLEKAGARIRHLKAKLFGGASVMSEFKHNKTSLGGRNVEIAHQILARYRIPIISADVGGNRGRKIVFHTDDGTVWVKQL